MAEIRDQVDELRKSLGLTKKHVAPYSVWKRKRVDADFWEAKLAELQSMTGGGDEEEHKILKTQQDEDSDSYSELSENDVPQSTEPLSEDEESSDVATESDIDDSTLDKIASGGSMKQPEPEPEPPAKQKKKKSRGVARKRDKPLPDDVKPMPRKSKPRQRAAAKPRRRIRVDDEPPTVAEEHKTTHNSPVEEEKKSVVRRGIRKVKLSDLKALVHAY